MNSYLITKIHTPEMLSNTRYDFLLAHCELSKIQLEHAIFQTIDYIQYDLNVFTEYARLASLLFVHQNKLWL